MSEMVVVGRDGKVHLAGGRRAAAGAVRWMRGLGFSNRVVRDYLLSRQFAYAASCMRSGSLPTRATLRKISRLRRYVELDKHLSVFRPK